MASFWAFPNVKRCQLINPSPQSILPNTTISVGKKKRLLETLISFEVRPRSWLSAAKGEKKIHQHPVWKSRRIWAKWGSYLHIQTWEFDFYLDSFLISFQARALEKMLFLIQNIWLHLYILTLGVMGIVKTGFALYFRIKSPLLDFSCCSFAKPSALRPHGL